MGLLKSLAAGHNGTTSVRIDRDIHTLLVRRLAAHGVGGNTRGEMAERVSASIRNHTGRLEDIAKRCVLGDMVMYATHGVSPILSVFTDAAAQTMVRSLNPLPAGGVTPATAEMYVSYMPIVLTQDGSCVSTSSDDDFVYLFENMDTAASYDFIGIEGDTTGTNILHYSNIDVLQDQHERNIDVDLITALVFPASSVFQRLLITHANGRISKHEIGELKYIASLYSASTVRYSAYIQGDLRVTARGAMEVDTMVLPLHSVSHLEFDTDGSPISFLAVQNVSRLAN